MAKLAFKNINIFSYQIKMSKEAVKKSENHFRNTMHSKFASIFTTQDIAWEEYTVVKYTKASTTVFLLGNSKEKEIVFPGLSGTHHK